jgi:hypothetical protein
MVMPAKYISLVYYFSDLFNKLALFLWNNIFLILILVLMYYLFYYQEVLETYLSFQFILNNPSKPVISRVYYLKNPEVSRNKIRKITKSNPSGVYIWTNKLNLNNRNVAID